VAFVPVFSRTAPPLPPAVLFAMVLVLIVVVPAGVPHRYAAPPPPLVEFPAMVLWSMASVPPK
jgi:hypothetical protein